MLSCEQLCCAPDHAGVEVVDTLDTEWDDEACARLKKHRSRIHRLRRTAKDVKAGVEKALKDLELAHFWRSVSRNLDTIDKKDGHGMTCLHRAVLKGRDRELAALCVAGAPLELGEEPPLLMAVKLGHADCVRVLVACGADKHKKNMQHFHPLLVAAEEGQAASFRVLCEALSKDGSLRTVAGYRGNGYTALHFAAVNNKPEILETALEYHEFRGHIDDVSNDETTGAPRARSLTDAMVKYQTALHKSVIYQHLACVQVLLRYDADPNARSRRPGLAEIRRQPNHDAELPVVSAVLNNDTDCVSMLLDYNANPQLAKESLRLQHKTDLGKWDDHDINASVQLLDAAISKQKPPAKKMRAAALAVVSAAKLSPDARPKSSFLPLVAPPKGDPDSSAPPRFNRRKKTRNRSPRASNTERPSDERLSNTLSDYLAFFSCST